MPTTHSPLRYPGGKSQIAPFIEKLIKLNQLEGGTYVEPFAGGAGIAWYLLHHDIVNKIVINDLSPSIYSFWDAVLRKSEVLCELIDKTPITIEEWYKQKVVQKESSGGIDLAFSTLFLNRVNRSGIINAEVIGGKAQAGKYKLDCRFNKQAIIDKIRLIADKSNQITLLNLDANDFLTEYCKGLDRTNTLINIDPPYYNKGKALYQNFFEHEDHQTLFSTIDKLKHAWVVTYDDTPEIFEIHKKYNPQKLELNYSLQIKRKGSELIVFSPQVINSSSTCQITA